jgi:hypothetical protein
MNKKGWFKKGHKFYKGGEKGWFKKGQNCGVQNINYNSNKRICLICGKEYRALKNTGKKFCSRKCMGERYKEVKQRPPLRRMFGKDNPQWKDGVTPVNKLLRGSSEFKKWREEVFEYDDYTCWICELTGRLHPHHLKSFSNYPALRFVKSNGLTLCEFCHKTYTDFGVQKQNG